MSEPTDQPKPHRVTTREAHAERVARAMRENLRKRKEQTRAREDRNEPPRDG